MDNQKETFVTVATKELNTRESSKNRGSRVNFYWSFTNYPDGWENREPWCAAFMCYVIRQGMKINSFLRTDTEPVFAACRDWEDWAKKNNCLIFSATDEKNSPALGDIVLFRFNNSDHANHIGLVTEFDGKTVYTIEGNTNKIGSREGDGVYEKERLIGACYKFIRTPVKAIPV